MLSIEKKEPSETPLMMVSGSRDSVVSGDWLNDFIIP